jgi:uncharacterized membrane protein required for colicin V production
MFDIIVLLLLVAGGVVGLLKGLITGIARLVGNIAAILVAYLFHKPFLALVEKAVPLHDLVGERVQSFISDATSRTFGGQSAAAALPDDLPQEVQDAINSGAWETLPPEVWAALPEEVRNALPAQASGVSGNVSDSLSGMGAQLTDYIVNGIGIFLLVVICGIVLNIVFSLLVRPLADTFGLINKGGGFLLGVIAVLILLVTIAGLSAPLIDTVESLATVKNSLSYPILLEGYSWLGKIISLISPNMPENPLATT